MARSVLVFSVLVSGVWADLAFPPGFKLGAGMSAFQNEGAWNVSGKSESILDVYFHQKSNETGDVSSDTYHKWKRDVQIAVELGLSHFRFSISWTRLLPSGYPDYVNKDGIRYYNNLIDALLQHDIEPVVTVHHFDIPQSLQDRGGWYNPQMTDWFADYARVVFSLFGDRVKTWLTINEPIMACYLIDPMVDPKRDDPLLCAKLVLIAHAKAWRIYDEEFKQKYKGGVSIVNQLVWYEGKTDKDEGLAELARQYATGLFSNPIYSERGGWPPVIELEIAKYSEKQGYCQSRLPAFTSDEIELVRGTYDFYALNYYTGRLVRKARPGEKVGTWPLQGGTELDLVFEVSPDWEKSESKDIPVYPEGLRYQLKWLKNQYGDIRMLITENGYPSKGEVLEDDKRIECINKHLNQVVLAINDGIRVDGYTAWSFIDTFEFASGYELHFGLYEVNFTSPDLTRTPRRSAHFYRSLTDSLQKCSN